MNVGSPSQVTNDVADLPHLEGDQQETTLTVTDAARIHPQAQNRSQDDTDRAGKNIQLKKDLLGTAEKELAILDIISLDRQRDRRSGHEMAVSSRNEYDGDLNLAVDQWSSNYECDENHISNATHMDDDNAPPSPPCPDGTLVDPLREADTVLLEATLVADRRSSHLRTDGNSTDNLVVEAQPLKRIHVQLSKCQWAVVCFCFVVLLAGALTLGLVLGVGQDNDIYIDNTAILDRRPPFRTDLPTATLESMQEDPFSHQALANEWMWDDPNLNNYTEKQQWQRFALASIYYALQGDFWNRSDHWLNYNVPECEWFSAHPVPICNEDGHLYVLNLTNNFLQGGVPNEIREFPYLKILDVSNNKIRGSPPPLQQRSNHLEVVVLSNNFFEGDILTEFGFLSLTLRVLRMDGNMLTGEPISMLLLVLPNLKEINASCNNYTGFLPSEWFGPDSQLEVVRVADNNLHGSIPDSLYETTSLIEIDLSGNNMIGRIPEGLGSTLLPNLAYFNLSRTLLTGSVPRDVCLLEERGNLQLGLNCEIVDCCY